MEFENAEDGLGACDGMPLLEKEDGKSINVVVSTQLLPLVGIVDQLFLVDEVVVCQ